MQGILAVICLPNNCKVEWFDDQKSPLSCALWKSFDQQQAPTLVVRFSITTTTLCIVFGWWPGEQGTSSSLLLEKRKARSIQPERAHIHPPLFCVTVCIHTYAAVFGMCVSARRRMLIPTIAALIHTHMQPPLRAFRSPPRTSSALPLFTTCVPLADFGLIHSFVVEYVWFATLKSLVVITLVAVTMMMTTTMFISLLSTRKSIQLGVWPERVECDFSMISLATTNTFYSKHPTKSKYYFPF